MKKIPMIMSLLAVLAVSAEAVLADASDALNSPAAPYVRQDKQPKPLDCKEIVVRPMCEDGWYMFDVGTDDVGRSDWSSIGNYPILAFCCKP